MRVFVYEAISAGAGGGQNTGSGPSGSLLAEGLSMVRAVTEDFAAISGVEVWGLRDSRLTDPGLPRHEVLIRSAAEEPSEFGRMANACDFVVIIAPELDGILAERVAWLQATRAHLLSPSGEFLAIASSKRRTAERLSDRGISVPAGMEIPRPGGVSWEELERTPLVLKRDDGAGSVEMQLIRDLQTLASLTQIASKDFRLEEFCPGFPASVAVLCGPAGNVALQPCEQILNPSTFEYLGGRTPLSPQLEDRARSLALAAVAAMPPTTGYVGIDLVLGEPAGGSRDVVIEINPRVTTSYVGLRQACRQNLAQAMLDVAHGRPVELSYTGEKVEFRADGSRLKR